MLPYCLLKVLSRHMNRGRDEAIVSTRGQQKHVKSLWLDKAILVMPKPLLMVLCSSHEIYIIYLYKKTCRASSLLDGSNETTLAPPSLNGLYVYLAVLTPCLAPKARPTSVRIRRPLRPAIPALETRMLKQTITRFQKMSKTAKMKSPCSRVCQPQQQDCTRQQHILFTPEKGRLLF